MNMLPRMILVGVLAIACTTVGCAGNCAVSTSKGAEKKQGEQIIWDNRPASADKRGKMKGDRVSSYYKSGAWERSWYPLGNGRLGCMSDGDPARICLQFNVDSLWTGDANISDAVSDKLAAANYKAMGAYQNFGELQVVIGGVASEGVTEYRRELNLATAVYSDKFKFGGNEIRRRIFVSAPDDAIFMDIQSTGKLNVTTLLNGTHREKTQTDDNGAYFSGRFGNGLEYVARVNCFNDERRAVIVLRAKTGSRNLPNVNTVDFDAALARHIADYRSYYDRMVFHLEQDASCANLPTRQRLQRVRKGKKDPSLIALLFNFGRYLLISSSRPGTLPANLQGIWNNSNNPPWHCDYHTNINIQMNYWGADSANLSDCFTPLSDWMLKTLPIVEAGTRAAFPNSKGYAYRTSANAVGGGGWRWNFAGAPWLAAQCYDHWLFIRDNKYLREVCWPLMKGAAEFMISTQLKERPDGTIVVKNGWSPEHGPREDGVAHDQQITRELFRSILSAAQTLGIDDSFVREVARMEPKLLGDKIGSWGQLQEWETDRDVKGNKHRHTSHLYAVYPGSTITLEKTPKLAAAAKVALAGRATTGDSRRSWVWPWRAALWARLGEADKANEMLSSLLKFNTMNNMFTTHPPFQIDGNLGMVGAICEILLEKRIPSSWPHGYVKGLKTREGKTIDFTW